MAEDASMGPASRYLEDFVRVSYLGSGSFGSVTKCQHKLDKQLYAIKRILFEDKHKTDTLREAQALASLHHPNIIKYHQAWIEDSVQDEYDFDYFGDISNTKCLCIQMEICPKSLDKMLSNGDKLEHFLVIKIFLQVLRGLEYLHSKCCAHLDIKPENLFLDGEDNIKIADFGLAVLSDRFRHDGKAYGCEDLICGRAGGILSYAAPELQKEKPVAGPSADIYSAGLLLFEMLYPEKDTNKKKASFHNVKLYGCFPDDLWLEYRKWILSMIETDPSARPSASLILQHFERKAKKLL